MDGSTRVFDSFRVEEAYNWRDDVMEITRMIVHETDEARLSNIANHFEVDLSEIRSFFEMKQQQQRKPKTNADFIRAMSDDELAKWRISEWYVPNCPKPCCCFDDEDENYTCADCWLDWLKKEVEECDLSKYV